MDGSVKQYELINPLRPALQTYTGWDGALSQTEQSATQKEMQITCCYDDCSCSVCDSRSDRDLNRASFTSTVKFDLA